MVCNDGLGSATSAAFMGVSRQYSVTPVAIEMTPAIATGSAHLAYTQPVRIAFASEPLRSLRLPFCAFGSSATPTLHAVSALIIKGLARLSPSLLLSSAVERTESTSCGARKNGPTDFTEALSARPAPITIAGVLLAGAYPLVTRLLSAFQDAFRCAAGRIAVSRLLQDRSLLAAETAGDFGHRRQIRNPLSGWALLLRERTSNPVRGHKNAPISCAFRSLSTDSIA